MVAEGVGVGVEAVGAVNLCGLGRRTGAEGTWRTRKEEGGGGGDMKDEDGGGWGWRDLWRTGGGGRGNRLQKT